MKKNIPDLRADHHEITLDHCYVLIDVLVESLDLIDGSPGLNRKIVDKIDPSLIQNTLEKYLKAPEFSRLFNEKTGMGKGVLVGIYLKELFDELIGMEYE